MTLSDAASGTASLYALLRRCCPDPDKVLIRTPAGRTIPYGVAHGMAGRIAAVLAGRGAVAGDRIAVRVDKSPEALLLYLACLRSGLVFLPLNTAYRREEVDFLIGDAEPRVVVCRPEDEEKTAHLAAAHGCDAVLTLGADGAGSLMTETAAMTAEAPEVSLPADALAVMLYTSGTTGKPKGAMLTQANLASNALSLTEAWRFTADDVLLHALPIFHAHGLFVACNTVMVAGGSLLWLPGFSPDGVLAALPGATAMMGVPTFYTRLLQDPRLTPERTRHIRLFVSGSAPLLAETHRDWQARTGHAILERYGMTETTMSTSNPYDGERRPGTVGTALPGIELRVTDEQTGAVLPSGAVGGLEVRGPNVMKGYWKLPEKTREDFTDDGWFKTGDIARIDADGYVSIVGRAKDMIISGGYNVYPKEVEAVIDDLEGVGESAVVGVPHPDFGEAGVAVVTLRPRAEISEAAVLAHCKAHLANFKVPKRAFFVETLPRNTMGKVQKALLREHHSALFTAGGPEKGKGERV